ncbi:S1/P1 nuclease [Massilia sp. 2TAF26]|uniref:S1/P1 nuclease n=1 Tax=Massilia sp. 2TAF26 TaxID=3233012 RepID=UPI003F992AED
MERFIRRPEPNSLSVRDLLEARDQYHVHLANLPTVIGTAVGRYRIRLKDKNFEDKNEESLSGELGPRTLLNSDVRDWSWPCVLVFVNRWLSLDELGKHPERTVPPVLYLSDGRQVRTCPILVERRDTNRSSAEAARYGATKFGPNFQMFVDDQGATRLGVASAVVEDGACAYILANQHLTAGADVGTGVYAYPRDKRSRVGHVTNRCVNSTALGAIYPGFSSRASELTLDACLVKLDNVTTTTSQYLGVGTVGEPVDLNADTMSLNLVGCPVFTELPGGIRTEGKIQGLFYRHSSIGGVDSLAEILIGPRDPAGSVETRPGDSGAVWFWDEDADEAKADQGAQTKADKDAGTSSGKAAAKVARAYRPLCVQWGGHGFLSQGTKDSTEFVLGTGFSSICKALAVEVVRDWGLGQSRYWGKVGHYAIGYFACSALESETAKTLFKANVVSIGVSTDDIVNGELPSAAHTDRFIQLADVPDLVWRRSRAKDAANHFADMDEEGKGKYAGKTLLDMWKDKATRTTQVWNDFYSSIDPKRLPKHRGALPFRVAQLFDVMKDAVQAGKLDEYICAAGVLAHYVGDACQPLHVSSLHHGLPDDNSDDKVHAVYEDDMLNYASAEMVAGVEERLKKHANTADFSDAAGAANAVVELMRRTINKLPPAEVLEVYNRVRGPKQSAALWAELGDRTMDCMADGSRTLAAIWQAAWTAGGGDTKGRFTKSDLAKPVDQAQLKALYETKTFAESKWLYEM